MCLSLHRLSVVSDQSAVSSSRASCPARQRGLILSQREGEFMAPRRPGSPHPFCPPSAPPHVSTFPQPPSKECHGSLCVNRQPTEMYSRITHISASHSQVQKYPDALVIDISVTRLRSHVCVYTQLNATS